jgi:hypothetical protein
MTVVERTASIVPESLRIAGSAPGRLEGWELEGWELEGWKAGSLEGWEA